MVENKLIGFCLPDIWDDDDAMYSLMQPIRRSKVVDPVNYNAKITFWKRILLSYAKNHKTFIICKQSLQKLFTRHFPVEGIDLYPQSLGEVISDLISEGLLEAVTPNKGILGSIFTTFSYIVHKPISWVYQYVNGQLHDSVETNTLDGQFVFSQFAEDSAVEFLSWFHDNYRDQSLLPNLSVYDLEIFSSALSSFYSHTASREYIFDLLNNNKHCVSVETISTLDSKPIQIIRVGEDICSRPIKPSSSDAAKVESSALSGIIQLRYTINQLENEEKRLETVIEQRRAHIKSLLLDKRNSEAKSLLRRTKTLEKSLEQKQLQLHNLETMLVDIESATENRNIVRVLSNVNEALKQAVGGSDALSQAEGVVNDVMDKIQESQEISDVVASFGLTSSGLEEMSDLEQELGRLLAAPRKTQPSFDDLEAELSALTLVTDKTDSSPDQNPVISKRKPVIISE
ncbi:Charged multivesicular body protein isoform 1 [Schistosoma japonicum]|uniref:Charged multivesicular body protein isoform 1 n=1 Tax=Schistosoma japonicum TaxID=6182 RepID=C1LI24_SCHJA|nr:Charged multivesicular body protein 7 [Schistosoma japonicum]TNN12951.1 Charged multivesicular body protein isoform 1 [Schistosoma japonicum]CAX74352.1 Protein CHMP7 [Schistosoma japonicum]